VVELKGVAHFSIPVSDIERSTRFYCDVVGCRHISTVARGTLAFLDAAGVCIILVKRDAPINPRPDDHNGVHHSFIVDASQYHSAIDHLRSHGVQIDFEETREGGVVNGPRAYFRDLDGTVLEFIALTSYEGVSGRLDASARNG
jgi:glyoxylase I family protein